MMRTEKCWVRNEAGVTIAVDLVVERVIKLRVDCGCFRHLSRTFEILVTKGSAYIRVEPDNPDEASYYREADCAGPLICAVERCTA